jgi:hypothetical protein
MNMPETITAGNVTATRTSPWASGFGKGGYDYRWSGGGKSGVVSVCCSQRAGAWNEPLMVYAWWELTTPRNQKPPAALVAKLRKAWERYVEAAGYIRTTGH